MGYMIPIFTPLCQVGILTFFVLSLIPLPFYRFSPAKTSIFSAANPPRSGNAHLKGSGMRTPLSAAVPAAKVPRKGWEQKTKRQEEMPCGANPHHLEEKLN